MSSPVYWSNGLLTCFDDCSTCLVTWLLPCYIAGRNAEAVGGSCCLHCIAYYIPIVNIFTRSSVRGRIREARGIAGSFWDDCLNVYYCGFLSLVQEAREVKEPGFQAMARE